MKDSEIQEYFRKHGHLNAYAERLNKLDRVELVQLLFRIGLGTHYFVTVKGVLTGELIDLASPKHIDGQYFAEYIIDRGCIIPITKEEETNDI